MVERRNRKRQVPDAPWRVFDRNTGDFLGHVANISTEGMMIRSEGEVDIDVILNLRIEFPRAIDGCTSLECDAVSLWSDRGSNPQFHNTGLQLLNLSQQDMRIVEKIMEHYPAQQK